MRAVENWRLCYAVMHDVLYEINKSIDLNEIHYRKDLDDSLARLAKICNSVDVKEHNKIGYLVQTKLKEEHV